jgi:hypothetical protein
MQIMSYVSGNHNDMWEMSSELSTESWTKIVIEQILENSKVMYRIFQDGNLVKNVENTTPTTFYQMEFWASDPFYTQQANTLIKNVEYTRTKDPCKYKML